MIVTNALITGVNSQDGSYLAELLLAKGYKVFGTVRSKNPKYPYGFNPNHPELEIFQVDLGYADSIRRLFLDTGYIHECYNLAAQSHVGYSFEHPEETYKVTGVGACLLMDEFFKQFPEGKFYQASSSEMFGNIGRPGGEFDLGMPFYPASPYAVAKLMAHYSVIAHREAGHFACDGVLFNHESERRHESFVTQKICKYVAELFANKIRGEPTPPKLRLGNIYTLRDWGYAPEYVEIMWNIMRQDSPKTYAIGTGKSVSVSDFLVMALRYVGIDPDIKKYFEKSSSFLRPVDVKYLCAEPHTANKLLGRELTQVEELVKIMMNHQLKLQGIEHASNL